MEQPQESQKNKKEWLKIILVLIILAVLLYKTEEYFGWIGYRETWTICIDYMNEGTLWSGQPHCEGAILPFVVLWGLDMLVGRELVQIAVIIFSTLISAMFFWVLWKVVQKEDLDNNPVWPLLLFGLLFYINTIITLESILNSFFFFIAYYILFYREESWKYYAVGFFLFLSMISKINVIIQIAFLLWWYAYEKRVWYFENKKLKLSINKEVLIGYIKVFVPIIIGFIILNMLYDYFWIYSWHVFTNQTIALSIFQTLKEMILPAFDKIEPLYVIEMLGIAFATYLWIKERKTYALLAGPCFFLAIFFIVRAFGITSALGVRYWSVMLPFAVLVLLKIKQTWTTKLLKPVMIGMLLVVVLYPGFYTGPFQLKDDLSYLDSWNIIDKSTSAWQEKDTFIKQIHYGYSIVPEQGGKILIEDDPAVFKRSIVSFGANIPYDQIDFLTKKYMESHPDVWGFPRYEELLGENLIYNPESTDLNEKEKEIVEKINAEYYSLIIYGPPEWAITQRLMSNLNNESLAGYCRVLVPNNVWLTKDGWHFSYFIFKEQADCDEMLQKMYFYFDQQFMDICTKDKETANMIATVMLQNNLPWTKQCNDGGDSLEFFKRGIGIKKVEFMVMILLFMLPFIYYGWEMQKSTEWTEKERKIIYGVLCILFLLLLLIVFFIDTTLPYKTGIVTAITGA